MSELTKDVIVKFLKYIDGDLVWIDNRGNNKVKGLIAGSLNKNGYRVVSIDGVYHYAHRVVFLYHNGYLPQYIDHIDGNKDNNKIDNLRECTKSQNEMNKGLSSSNNSGYKGVGFVRSLNKWRARITINKKEKHIGYYTDINDAVAAYKESANIHFKEYNREIQL